MSSTTTTTRSSSRTNKLIQNVLAVTILTVMALGIHLAPVVTIVSVTGFFLVFQTLMRRVQMRHYYGPTTSLVELDGARGEEYQRYTNEILWFAGLPNATLRVMATNNPNLPGVDIYADTNRKLVLVSQDAYFLPPEKFRAALAANIFYEKTIWSKLFPFSLLIIPIGIALIRLGYVAVFGMEGLPLLEATFLVVTTFCMSVTLESLNRSSLIRVAQKADDEAFQVLGRDYIQGLEAIAYSCKGKNAANRRVQAVCQGRLARLLNQQS